MDLNRLNGASSRLVKDAFFSNYFAALIFMRLLDKQGLSLIADQSASALSAFSPDMSDLRFWGKTLFYPDDPEVNDRLLRGHAAVLAEESGRVMESRVDRVMRITQGDPKTAEWSEVSQSLAILRERFDMYRSEYFSSIGDAIIRWDSISQRRRGSAINRCVRYLAMSDSTSALLPRLRELAPGSVLRSLLGELKDIVRS